MQASLSTGPSLCLALALTLLAPGLPAVADPGGHDAAAKDVRVKVIECEDGDCAELSEAMGEDGDIRVTLGDGEEKKIVIRKVHCDGEDCEDPSSFHNMVFFGDDGEIEIKGGDAAYEWVSHHAGLLAGNGYLGVGLTELTPELREHFGVPAGSGVMVSKVSESSPASKAGLAVGDIIASVDGESVDRGSVLARVIRAHEAGDEVVLEVWRDGLSSSITAAVEEREMIGHHRRHGDDQDIKVRKVMIECDSENEECGSIFESSGLGEFDCGGSEECEVKVECRQGGCACSINGEDADCASIPGVPGR